MKKRFTEEQIIRILKEKDDGKKAADIVRENNISEQTFTVGKASTAACMSARRKD